MNRDYGNVICALQVDCCYSDRSELTWRDNLCSDYEHLYHFMKGGCKPHALAPEQYKRLCDKGYIFEDRVQVMSYRLPAGEAGCDGEVIFKKILQDKVKVPEEVKAYEKEFDQREFEYLKDKYPEHMQGLVKQYSMNSLHGGTMVPYVIAELLERGMLKPLRDLQKKSVLTVIAYKE